MAQKYLCVYHDWLATFQGLGYDRAGRLLIAALEYDINGKLPDLDGNLKYVWPLIQATIDRNKESYNKRCEINRKNRLSKTNRHESTTNCHESSRIVTNRDNRIEENKREEKKNNYPTLEEVREYAKSRNSLVDPDFFYDYFSARDWIDSKGSPVLNWKSKFITWEKKEKEKKAKEEQKPDLSWFHEDAHGIRR